MITLELNGQTYAMSCGGIASFDELLARIREERAPDEVISSAWWNGSPLSEGDLQRDPSSESGVLSINTRRREAYVRERLLAAERYVAQVSDSFSQSIHAFRTGHSGYGNMFLARGIDELLSFVAWYSTILGLEAPGLSLQQGEQQFFGVVNDIQRTSERLVAAQVLESSFTIATELETRLFPLLARLKDCCLANAKLLPGVEPEALAG